MVVIHNSDNTSLENTAPTKTDVVDPNSSLSDDEDEEEEQAAELAGMLSVAQTSHLPTTDPETTSDGSVPDEVFYSDGATPLFLCLEECQWQDALQICQEHPEYLKTWVKSTGEDAAPAVEETTSLSTAGSSAWTLWRRLPIHEAARRQAPAWLMANMLSLYPESARQKTQFGELPLHLVVETNATPEVVNLFLVYYFPGISSKDNSGRTPLDILHQEENDASTELDAHQEHVDVAHLVVKESLTRSHLTYKQMMQQFQQGVKKLKDKHKMQMSKMEKKHAQKMQVAREQHAALEEALGKVQAYAQDMEAQRQQGKQQAASHESEKVAWQNEQSALQTQITVLEKEKEEELAVVQDLCGELEQRDVRISKLESELSLLKEDLVRVTLAQQSSLSGVVAEHKADLERFMASHHALQGQLTGQAKGLTMLLQERGIALPPPPPPPPPPLPSTPTASGLSSKMSQEEVDEVNTHAAARAAWAAEAALERAADSEPQEETSEERTTPATAAAAPLAPVDAAKVTEPKEEGDDEDAPPHSWSMSM